MKQSNFIIELQYQYLNYITGIPVLYKILKKIHNTGKKNYTSDRQVQEIHFVLLDIQACKKGFFTRLNQIKYYLLPVKSALTV